MTAATYRFFIDTAPDPQALPRLIGYFAQRNLVPERVGAEVRSGTLLVSIVQGGLEPPHAAIIAEKMRSSVLVEDVILEEFPPAAS